MSTIDVYGDLVRYRELFGNLFRRDVQAKYRGSALGVLWTIANPVLLMGVYLLVFSVVLGARFGKVDHYALFLLSGLAVWTFFAAALQSSTRSMLDNANLIRKTRFPRQLVPLSVVGAHLVSFAVMLVLLLALNFAVLPRVRATEWLAIPLAACFVALVGGLALAAASLNVLFRDVEFVVAALLLPWFFLTPVIYPLTGVGIAQHHHTVVQVLHWGNVVTPGLQAIRDPLFAGRLPHWGDALYLVVAAMVALALGALVFSRIDDQIAVEV
jgi:ABC-type polysaccharide/polyol phosphate export permease